MGGVAHAAASFAQLDWLVAWLDKLKCLNLFLSMALIPSCCDEHSWIAEVYFWRTSHQHRPCPPRLQRRRDTHWSLSTQTLLFATCWDTLKLFSWFCISPILICCARPRLFYLAFEFCPLCKRAAVFQQLAWFNLFIVNQKFYRLGNIRFVCVLSWNFILSWM